MDFYNFHNVKIRALVFGRMKADEILESHDRHGDIDRYYISHEEKDSDGFYTVTYRIAPIVYEDLEKIKNEFEQNGIQVL